MPCPAVSASRTLSEIYLNTHVARVVRDGWDVAARLPPKITMFSKTHQVALLLTFGRLCYGFKPSPRPNGALKARNDCTAPCGWSNQFYTQECCGDNSICITDAFNSGTCGPRDTVFTSVIGGTPTTIETTIVQTSTVTATQQARTSAPPTSTPRPSTTSTLDTTSEASATSSSTLEPRQDTSEWPIWKKIVVGAGSGLGLVLIAAAVTFFSRNRRKDSPREDGARDNASSMFARVSPHRHSRQELNEIRGEAVDEVAPPKYDNSAPNPFTAAAFARSKSQQLNRNARAAAAGK